MMASPGSAANPLCVAIVGSGPSGFYATEALFKSELEVRVNLLDRLPSPFGLVRSGVAPDHPKLKQAIEVYKKIAQDPQFNFIGNVNVGRDVSPAELRRMHHAVIYTCGAEADRKLGIPGEDLAGSCTATEFVGWYNGHPDYRDRSFDLSGRSAMIIGQGNVAADVARILSKSPDDLKHTDIAAHALDALARSRLRTIYVVGRRGPAQAKFTRKELREFLDLENCRSYAAPDELVLNPASEAETAGKSGAAARKNLEIFRQFSASEDSGKPRTCHFTFLKSPVLFAGSERLERVVLEKNRLSGEPFSQSARGSGDTMELDCDIVFRSIGYHGVEISGVPFDARSGTFPNQDGRVTGAPGGSVIPGVYAAGWIKRGPSGIIGTNRACAVETVHALVADAAGLEAPEGDAEALYALLDERGVRHIGYPHWLKMDAGEIRRGAPAGKPREKFTRIPEMLAVAGVD